MLLPKVKLCAIGLIFALTSGCAVIDLSTPGQATVIGIAEVQSQPLSADETAGETLTVVSYGLSLMLTSKEYALTLGHHRVSVAQLKDNALVTGTLILE